MKKEEELKKSGKRREDSCKIIIKNKEKREEAASRAPLPALVSASLVRRLWCEDLIYTRVRIKAPAAKQQRQLWLQTPSVK